MLTHANGLIYSSCLKSLTFLDLTPFAVLEISYTTRHRRAIRGMLHTCRSKVRSSSHSQLPSFDTCFSAVFCVSHRDFPPWNRPAWTPTWKTAVKAEKVAGCYTNFKQQQCYCHTVPFYQNSFWVCYITITKGEKPAINCSPVRCKLDLHKTRSVTSIICVPSMFNQTAKRESCEMCFSWTVESGLNISVADFLWYYLNIHYHVYNSPPLDPVRSQINPFHASPF